jgi:DNA-binding NarL/FixJ family response regulator
MNPTNVPTNVLLVDSHRLFREGLRSLLEEKQDYCVVGEAADGRQAYEMTQRLQPDVVITELELDGSSGLDLLEKLGGEEPLTRTLVLSWQDSRRRVEEALRLGAAGYMLKTGSFKELEDAMEAVRSGRVYLSPAVAQHLVDSITGEHGQSCAALSSLTARERQVLQLIADGLSTKEIAVQLGISDKTADSHRSNLMEKLGIHKVPGLVRFAIREGLIEP